MSRQHVDTRVQGAETWFARHGGETTIVRDKVDHFLLHVLSKVFHLFGPLGHAGGGDHMRTDLGGIFIVLEGQSPIGGECIFGRLCGDGDFGTGHGGSHDDGGGSGQSDPTHDFQEIRSTGGGLLRGGVCWVIGGKVNKGGEEVMNGAKRREEERERERERWNI